MSDWTFDVEEQLDAAAQMLVKARAGLILIAEASYYERCKRLARETLEEMDDAWNCKRIPPNPLKPQ